MTPVYLGLGSNVGDSADLMRSAFSALSSTLRSARLSSLWRSKARYVVEQPDFTNAVCAGETELRPDELLSMIHEIEARFGRDRSREVLKGPRSLDIDILLYGAQVLRQSDLIIPHEGLRERKFALLPLVELAPDLRDPLTGEPYAAILARLPAQGIYHLRSHDYDRLYL